MKNIKDMSTEELKEFTDSAVKMFVENSSMDLPIVISESMLEKEDN